MDIALPEEQYETCWVALLKATPIVIFKALRRILRHPEARNSMWWGNVGHIVDVQTGKCDYEISDSTI